MGRSDLRGPGNGALPPSTLPRQCALALIAIFALFVSGCSSIVIHDRPILDRSSQDLIDVKTPAPAEPLALIQAGMALDRKQPTWAITYYRDAALRALPAVESEGVTSDLDLSGANGAQATYRRAIEYILVAANRQAIRDRVPWTEILARAGIGVDGIVGLYPAARWEEIRPTREFEIKGFRNRAGQGGLGAPVVVKLSRSADRGDYTLEGGVPLMNPSEAHFPKKLYRGASAVLRPGRGAEESQAVLELHDPVREPEMYWQASAGGPSLPLAYDMTVPTARQFHEGNFEVLGKLAVLYPSEYNGRTGIYMVDPYDPKKIPVVFVHGLASTPEGWMNAINELRGDPSLRHRYQFWMFFYSTGNPLLASAARLRKSLREIRTELDPGEKDQAFDQLVVIGHSMGGILTRLMISSSGQVLWNAASKVPPDQIDLEPELKDLLTQAMFFEPVPMVRRTVFIATPHQGSPVGDELVGRIASRMIRVPSDILQIRQALARSNGVGDVSEAFRGNRYATSVAQLGMGNPVLKAVNQVKISEKVPFHSIVGYNGEQPLPIGGDGVVPYTSAHLQGALSELVVSSNHSAQETEPAIRELKRILILHHAEYAAERRALARGEEPPLRVSRPAGQTPIRYQLTPADQSAPESRFARFELPFSPAVTR